MASRNTFGGANVRCYSTPSGLAWSPLSRRSVQGVCHWHTSPARSVRTSAPPARTRPSGYEVWAKMVFGAVQPFPALSAWKFSRKPAILSANSIAPFPRLGQRLGQAKEEHEISGQNLCRIKRRKSRIGHPQNMPPGAIVWAVTILDRTTVHIVKPSFRTAYH